MSNVAVTGMNAGDSPAPGVPVVRCLREYPHWSGRIIGLAYDALESGILDPRMVDSAYLIPYPSTGSEALRERIRIIHEIERINVIIPNLDSEIQNFISIEKDLEQMGIRVFLPSAEQLKARAKVNLPGFAKASGIATPDTTIISDAAAIQVDEKKFPLVVKGLFYEAYVVHHRDAALQMIHKLASTWGYPVLLQEFIPGEEFNVAAVGDGTGRMVEVACMKKLVFTDKRKGWACVSISNPSLMEFAESIIRALKWRGPIEIEAIQSKSTGQFYLIELNPRFPAWIYLAKAAGVNIPGTLLSMILEEQTPSFAQARAGVVFTNYTTNLVADLNSIAGLFTNGELHYEKNL